MSHRRIRKRIVASLVLGGALITVGFCLADDQRDRFVEFPNDDSVTTYDLRTVQIIQPGRFSIISITIDNSDVMEFELKTLNALRAYCVRPPGDYPAPTDIFTLGPPDMPIKTVRVGADYIMWSYPYRKLGNGNDGEREKLLICRGEPKSEAEWMLDQRAEITNGQKSKELFDCKRGLKGWFFPGENDPAKVITRAVKLGTVGAYQYSRVCVAVMHEMPYLPEQQPRK